MRTMYEAMFGLGLVGAVRQPGVRPRAGRGFGMRRRWRLAMLIGNDSVQKELKLDDQQNEKAKELAEKARERMREKFAELQDLSQEERRDQDAEITKEMNESAMKAVGEFLKPEQIARLKQISLSDTRGNGLQRSRGRQEAQPHRHPEERNPSDRPGIDGADARGLREQNQDDREAIDEEDGRAAQGDPRKAAAKLNDEQQKTWKELIGAPFEIKIEPRPQQ